MKKVILVLCLITMGLTIDAENRNSILDNTHVQIDCAEYAANAVDAEMEHYGEWYDINEYADSYVNYQAFCEMSQLFGAGVLNPVFL